MKKNKRKLWSNYEEKIIIEGCSVYSGEKLSKRLNRTPYAVEKRFNKLKTDGRIPKKTYIRWKKGNPRCYGKINEKKIEIMSAHTQKIKNRDQFEIQPISKQKTFARIALEKFYRIMHGSDDYISLCSIKHELPPNRGFTASSDIVDIPPRVLNVYKSQPKNKSKI